MLVALTVTKNEQKSCNDVTPPPPIESGEELTSVVPTTLFHVAAPKPNC